MSAGPGVATAAGPGAIDDPSIPVLTDRIYLPAVELDMALPAAPVAAPPEQAAVPGEADELETAEPIVPPSEPAGAAQHSESQPEPAPHADETAAAQVVVKAQVEQPAAGDEQAEAATLGDMPATPMATTDAIEAQAEAVRTAVLQRVAERLPEQVNAAVRDLMQPAIDQAMARLGEEAQVALRITLQDLVEQVLREELARRNIGEAPR